MSSKKDKVLFALTLIFLAISSFSLLGVAEGSFDEAYGSKSIAIAVAVAFWFGLIIGYIFLTVLNSSRKQARKKASGRNKADGTRCGALQFFSNPAGIIADSVMIIFLIVFVIFRILDDVSAYLDLTVIAVLVYSVHLHGILNGRNFMFVTSSASAKKLEMQENRVDRQRKSKPEPSESNDLFDSDEKTEKTEIKEKSEKAERPVRQERPVRPDRPEQRRSTEPRYKSEPRYRTENRERPEQRYRQNKPDRPEKRN